MSQSTQQIIQKRPAHRPIEYTQERIHEIADGLLEFMSQPKNFWLKDYAIQLGIDPARLSELANKDDYFSQALHRAKAIQESKIVKGGLGIDKRNQFNAQMAKFTLMNVSGWRESGAIDMTSGGEKLGYIALPETKSIEAIDIIDVEPE